MALTFRFAQETDTLLILQFIRELADYEHLLDQVVADEATLRDQLFEKRRAEVLFALEDGAEVGFALFFQNFSTFLGRAGLYLEDLYVRPEHRGKGYGKAFFRRLAAIAAEQDCGRLEWWCLDGPVLHGLHPQHRLLQVPGGGDHGGLDRLPPYRTGIAEAGRTGISGCGNR